MTKQLSEKISLDDKAILIIAVFFLVMILTRFVWGFVPWYLAVAMVPMGLAALLRPKAGICALLFLTILFERFFTLEGFQFGRDIVKLYPLDVLLLGVYGNIGFRMVFGKIRFSFKTSDRWLSAFFLLATVYCIVSFFGFGESSVATAFSTWKNYVFYGALAFVLPLLFDSERDIVSIAKYFFGATAIGLVFILIGLARGEGLWTEYTPLSTEGVRLLAFPHAFYFSLAFLALFAGTRLWFRNRFRYLVWSALTLWGIGIVGSLMRHMWIGMICAIAYALVFLLDRPARRAVARMTAVIGSLAVVFLSGALIFSLLFPATMIGRTIGVASTTVSERVFSIGDAADESISWRGSTWASAFATLAEHPFLGTGFGLKIPVESGDYHDFVEVRNIHNSWLALLVQTGLIGFFVLSVALVSLWFSVVRTGALSETLSAARGVSLTLGAYFGIILLAQPYLETNLMGIFFWMTVGLARATVGLAHGRQHTGTSSVYEGTSTLVV